MSEIKVFTYNLRMDAACDGINAFSQRKDFVLAEFPKYEADIIGFQEVLPHMREWLVNSFPEYQICGVGRFNDYGNESNVVAFRKDKFDLLSLDTFWLSDTPRVPGSIFSTDQSSCPRICTTVTLIHKESKKTFRHYNTHLDHVGRFAQAQGISLILNRIAADYSVAPMPVIITGDFNVLPDSIVRKSVLEFNGCGEKLRDVTAGVGMTFHSYHPEKHNDGLQIDYIFTNMKCDETKSFTAKDEKEGVYLSDHYPVGAFVEI